MTTAARPRLFQAILPLTRAGATRDIVAGFTLAAMNVPQALGYTRIAGTPVVTGLYTLLLPLVAFAAFGSSRYLVVAADSATAAILAGGLTRLAIPGSAHYLALAGTVALLTAGCLLAARLLRLGFLADFLSQTVLVGFLTGVGFQVGIAMLGEMLGLRIDATRTLAQLAQVARQAPLTHAPTALLSLTVVAIVLAARHLAPRFPAPLLVVAGTIAASAAFDFAGRGIALVPAVTGGLPHLALPAVGWREVPSLLPIAASCFVMIVAQSAATARAWAARHRQELDEDADLVGLSAANAAAALSGTFVVNGSPTQTAMVETSGGRSQMAQLATAAVVALVLLFLAGWLRYLPQCVLGAIVFTIAVGLVDLPGLRAIRRESPGEWRLALVTAAAVVGIGVEQGILLAIGLSLLRHVRHSYAPHTAVLVQDAAGQWVARPAAAGTLTESGVVVFRFSADLFYANAGRFVRDAHRVVDDAPVRWLVLDAGAITAVDYSAARALRELCRDLADAGVGVLIVHPEPSLRADLARHRVLDVIGPGRLFETLRAAQSAIRDGRVPDAPPSGQYDSSVNVTLPRKTQ